MIRIIKKAGRLLMWIYLQAWKQRKKAHNRVETHVTLDAIAIHRYVLSLHRIALRNGEDLILHTSIPSVIKAHNIDHGHYHSMAYDECSVSFTNPKGKATILDHHYFQHSDDYRIPIGFHPLFIPPNSVSISEKKLGSVQFLGYTHPMYERFDSEFWHMPTRLATLNLIQESHPELGLLIPEIDKYRDLLLETQYFICLPGVCMPLCHNLYECVICGCIPVLHFNYAKWLDPELQSLLKPVTYHNDNELLEWISRIKSGHFISRPDELALDLMAHCKTSLSWPYIKSSLINSEKALICAEEISVKLALEA